MVSKIAIQGPVVGSCEYVNEHSGYANSREFLSSSAVVFTGIINQNRKKKVSSKMYGQLHPFDL